MLMMSKVIQFLHLFVMIPFDYDRNIFLATYKKMLTPPLAPLGIFIVG